MKLIGLDVGTKRIGVAKADSNVRVAVPYSTIEVDGEEFKKIASLARAWDINCFVIGLPRSNEGNETKQSGYARAFAKDLKSELPDAKICFQDESLTSVEAEKRLKKHKKGGKKGDIDSEAAAIILQDFLESHGSNKSVTKATAAKHHSVKGTKQPRTHHLATAIIIILVTLLIGCGAGFGYYMYCLQPVNPEACDGVESTPDGAETTNTAPKCNVTFSVADGESTSSVALNLRDADLIRNSIVFQLYYRLSYPSEATIKAGEYELNSTMTPGQILDILTAGTNDKNVFSLTILPGSTKMDIKKQLEEKGYNSAEIDAALADSYSDQDFAWMFEGRPEAAGVEGYLFGETYEFYRSDDVKTIIMRMLSEMAKVIEENDLKTKFSEHGLNLYQGVTLASIVQKEANNGADWARVAQVFYNRLAANMSLGSDVTTQYAVDLVDPDRQTYTDNAAALEIDSPYNTRKYPGLPYGPISNPGVEALLATANPDAEYANQYLFFLTGDDGVMYYSTTEEGHQQNISDHCQALCSVAL